MPRVKQLSRKDIIETPEFKKCRELVSRIGAVYNLYLYDDELRQASKTLNSMAAGINWVAILLYGWKDGGLEPLDISRWSAEVLCVVGALMVESK